MRLEINPRGNGACPICAYNKNCKIQRKLAENVDELFSAGEEGMEIVIYSCPQFKEKVLP